MGDESGRAEEDPSIDGTADTGDDPSTGRKETGGDATAEREDWSDLPLGRRIRSVWRRVFALSWPVMVEHTTRTLMRTTDIIVTGLFSPAAIAAIGLADLFARFPLRIGLGLGGGAIALSSQDTGAGAEATRDEAVTQALLLGALAGVPFVAIGWLFGPALIALLGAPPEVARMGGTYLAIVFATAPARHVALIGARSLQGTGDTRTPMYVNIVANVLNVAGSATLGLGLFGFPALSIVGVGLATAAANVASALAFLAAIGTSWTPASFARPSDATVARQLVVVSTPRVAEGLVATLAEFPFNAILLGFGTEVNAAFQVGRRAYQQVTAPFSRGYSVAANVVVGQSLGQGDETRARFEGWATAALGVVSVGAIGLALVAGAPLFVGVFTEDPVTFGYAVDFARVYGLSATLLVLFTVLSGALQGGSETRTPFVARVTATFGFMLGATYLVGVVLGYGVLGAYVGVASTYAWMALVVVLGFQYVDWGRRAADMMAERAGDAAEEAGSD